MILEICVLVLKREGHAPLFRYPVQFLSWIKIAFVSTYTSISDVAEKKEKKYKWVTLDHAEQRLICVRALQGPNRTWTKTSLLHQHARACHAHLQRVWEIGHLFSASNYHILKPQGHPFLSSTNVRIRSQKLLCAVSVFDTNHSAGASVESPQLWANRHPVLLKVHLPSKIRPPGEIILGFFMTT